MSQAGGSSFGLLAGAEERAEAEPLLYSFSHGARGDLSSLAKKRPSCGLGGNSAQEEAGLREGCPAQWGRSFAWSPCPPSQHFPKCPADSPSSWPTAWLFGADSAGPPASCHLSASRALFEEGLCPCDCGQIPAPGCSPQRQPQALVRALGLGPRPRMSSQAAALWVLAAACSFLIEKIKLKLCPVAQHPEEVLWPFLCPACSQSRCRVPPFPHQDHREHGRGCCCRLS